MGAIQRIQAMLDRLKPSDLFTCMAVDRDIIFFEEGAIGTIMQGNFVTGANAKIQTLLANVVAEEYPADTFIQDIQMGVPDLKDELDPYRTARLFAHGFNKVARQACLDRADFVERAAHNPISSGVKNLILDTRHYVTLKVPVVGYPMPTEKEVRAFRELREKLISMYESASIKLTPMGPDGYLSVMRRYLNMLGDWDTSYDEQALLRDQIGAPGTRIKNRVQTVRVDHPAGKRGRQHIGMLTVKRYPKRAGLGMMDLMRGMPDGTGTQITLPYAITTTIRIPDQNSKVSGVRAKSVLVTQQAHGNMMKWVPLLAAKKKGFDVLGAAIDNGAKAVEVNTTVMVFSPSTSKINKQLSSLKQLYSTFDMQMAPERYIVWPSVFNSMPLCPTVESIENTHRFKTMGSNHAAVFLPVIDEWRGYGEAIVLATRRGRNFLYDFFSKMNNNYNWLLFAEAGAGKSFAVQRFVQDYLALGAQIWIVDKGKSHAKFTRAHGGEYIEFTERAIYSLNPFSDVTDINESIGMLSALVGKMCNPAEGVNSGELSRIIEAIKSTYSSRGRKMDITNVYQYLSNQVNDQVSLELAKRLYVFTREGPYGAWFDGPSNFNPNAQLTTLELAGLTNHKHLQQVVLQLLTIRVEQMMFLHQNDPRKKMLIVEEGGDLMKEESFAVFLGALYSKVRKETGSVGMVLQSLAQLYGSSQGPTIAASANTKIIMEQTPEAINFARSKEYVEFSDYEATVLKGLTTVKGRAGYSEMYVMTPKGSGVARLYESRFNQVLFSSEGDERNEILAALDRGEDVPQAVNKFIARERELSEHY